MARVQIPVGALSAERSEAKVATKGFELHESQPAQRSEQDCAVAGEPDARKRRGDSRTDRSEHRHPRRGPRFE